MFISRKKYDSLMKETNLLIEQVERLNKRAVLIGIDRDGRINKFIFARGTNTEVIETMGLISDNIGEWKEKLING